MSSFERPVYALYVGVQSVELRFNEDTDVGTARFICAQANYQQILDFGRELAKSKGLPLVDYTKQPNKGLSRDKGKKVPDDLEAL